MQTVAGALSPIKKMVNNLNTVVNQRVKELEKSNSRIASEKAASHKKMAVEDARQQEDVAELQQAQAILKKLNEVLGVQVD